MADRMSPEALKSLLEGNTQFAFIDVREAGEYNTSHIPGASLIVRRQLEFQMLLAVPHQSTPVILCDDDGRRAPLAAATVERMGYRHVSVLDGGINRWVSRDYPTEWGSNVPSKDFGEKVEVVHHVPELEATELHERMARGDKLVILDTRTPEEVSTLLYSWGTQRSWGRAGPTDHRHHQRPRPRYHRYRQLCRTHAQYHWHQGIATHGPEKRVWPEKRYVGLDAGWVSARDRR